jgi:hypothetical protein
MTMTQLPLPPLQTLRPRRKTKRVVLLKRRVVQVLPQRRKRQINSP